jgi:hypothetical protein
MKGRSKVANLFGGIGVDEHIQEVVIHQTLYQWLALQPTVMENDMLAGY